MLVKISILNFLVENTSDSTKLSNFEISLNTKFFIIKNYLEENKDFKSFDENDVNIIIKGLSQILFHFMNIENPILQLDKMYI